jgi:hypothetical protein
MFKLIGTVKVIFESVNVTDKFSKREFVVSTDVNSMYPQDVIFQLTQDRIGFIDNVNVNDNVEVSFNIRGREWTSPQGEVRYFNTLDAFRVEKIGQTTDNQQIASATINKPITPIETSITDKEDDDLPF